MSDLTVYAAPKDAVVYIDGAPIPVLVSGAAGGGGGGGASVSDTPFGPAWDDETATAPTQNAVYDELVKKLDFEVPTGWGSSYSFHRPSIADGGVGALSNDGDTLAYLWVNDSGNAGVDVGDEDYTHYVSLTLDATQPKISVAAGDHVEFNETPYVGAVPLALLTDVSGGGASVDAFEYSFSAATGTPPGANQVRLNAAPASATHIYVDDLTTNGFDPTNFFLACASGDVIAMQDKDDASIYHRFNFVSVTDAGAYIDLTVTHASGSGTFNGGQPTVVAIVQPTAASSVLPDGDYGDVVVSSSGAVMKVESAQPADGSFDVTGAINGTGNLVLNKPTGDLNLDLHAVDGQYRTLRFFAGGLQQFGFGTDTSGGFGIARYDYAGAYQEFTLTISRSTGIVTFGKDVVVPDEAYGSGWNGSLEVPTKNAVYDKIETLGGGGGSVSDTAYGAGWDGDTTNAPSKNAVYDKIESLGSGSGSGSRAVNLGTMRPLTDFTQINIGSTRTATETSGKAICIKEASPDATTRIVGLRRPLQSTTARTAVFVQPNLTNRRHHLVSFGFSDGTKFHVLTIGNLNSTDGMEEQTWSNSTTRVTPTVVSNTRPVTYYGSGFWLGMRVDASAGKAYYEVSGDGVNFATLFVVTMSSGYLGSSGYVNAYVGLFAFNTDVGGTDYPASIAALYWDDDGLSRTYGSGGGGSTAQILCRFLARDNEPPASAYATQDTRNSHPVLAFDAATDESAVFSDYLPAQYAGAGLTVRLVWSAASATSGTCRWSVAFERLADADTQTDDLDTDSFATALTTGASPPAGSAGQLQYTDIAFTNAQLDGLLAGEFFRLKVMRDADGTSGTDDMAGDAHLRGVSIRQA